MEKNHWEFRLAQKWRKQGAVVVGLKCTLVTMTGSEMASVADESVKETAAIK